jgi:hypothetical protein
MEKAWFGKDLDLMNLHGSLATAADSSIVENKIICNLDIFVQLSDSKAKIWLTIFGTWSLILIF